VSVFGGVTNNLEKFLTRKDATRIWASKIFVVAVELGGGQCQ